MAYHTATYLFVFLPVVLLAYQFAPRKLRWAVLLGAGYVFFWSFSGRLLLFLIGTTLFSHYIGVWLSWLKCHCRQEEEQAEKNDRKTIRNTYKKKERLVLALGIILILAVLAYLKYYNFFANNANAVLDRAGLCFAFEARQLILPIGISFYTLQAIGYMADVYWEKMPAEKHLGKLALFLAFFPQIMEGPISMYSQTADQLWECRSLKSENLTSGAIRIIWGLFKKMIIADRLYILVREVFGHHDKYSGAVIAVAAMAYTVQLYMEFSGCMDIVIGSGRLFGVTLPENFRQPFASKSASEFWRRWHITLGVWLKTYIFYPVSASSVVKRWNKFGRKHFGKHLTKVGVSAIALFPVWLCNGLWHGASWSYIFYGMYYFTILLLGVAVEPARNKLLAICRIDENAFYWRSIRILKTWVIIFVGELFFRADGLRAGLAMFRSMFRDFDLHILWDETLLGFGLDKGDYLVIMTGCLTVAVVGMIKERRLLGDAPLAGMWTPARWALYYTLILAVVIFGAYGIGYQQVDLIYAGF